MSSSNKEKTAEEVRTYYAETPIDERRMLTLVSMCLRSYALEIVFWARNEDKIGQGLFEYCEPYEEADRILEKLRAFGYLPKQEAK